MSVVRGILGQIAPCGNGGEISMDRPNSSLMAVAADPIIMFMASVTALR